jgi:lipoate-protein ligase A
MHRDITEVDSGYCSAFGLPVYRRMVGGGPVYLDPGQLFFQLILPAARVVARRAQVLAELLEPAARVLRSLGVAATVDRYGEITVGGAKVCGHGAGQLRDGVAVVGNLITAFDHQRAARVLHLETDTRAEVERLMRRYVAATPVDAQEWKALMVEQYAVHFGEAPRAGRPTVAELDELRVVDARLGNAEFVAGQARPRGSVRTVKVRAGVWVHDWRSEGQRLVLAVADGVVERAFGTGDRISPAALIGLPLNEARSELACDEATAALAAALGAANMEVVAA